jgi:hypothetical protein
MFVTKERVIGHIIGFSIAVAIGLLINAHPTKIQVPPTDITPVDQNTVVVETPVPVVEPNRPTARKTPRVVWGPGLDHNLRPNARIEK